MKSLELFAGAGGLALGMSKAGFEHVAVIERDSEACKTFRENQEHHTDLVERWPILETDAAKFDYTVYEGRIDVLSGGPPCQPFSMAGKHRAHEDERDMFPVAVRAVRETRPRAFLLENVRGLTRPKFSEYLSHIITQLRHPEIARRESETLQDHRLRLMAEDVGRQPSYDVRIKVVNAADYGVPQRRERVFIVGFRSDVAIDWDFPAPTHSREALLHSQLVTGNYWREHDCSSRVQSGPFRPGLLRVGDLNPSALIRWRTVRDALAGLPDPEDGAPSEIANHVFRPGARAYKGHSGSHLDEPSKTLKAGQHGVPGGENMLVRDDATVRYFTVREAARIQTFPDEYTFRGVWTQPMRQLGNAVPVALARAIAQSIGDALTAADGGEKR